MAHGIAEGAVEQRVRPGGSGHSSSGVVIGHDAVRVSWTVLLSVILVTLVAVYLGFIRPATLQLAMMQRQIARLERGVQRLTGELATAERSVNLLDLLVEQGEKSVTAAASLDQINHMQQQLIERSENLRDVVLAADRIERIRREVQRQNDLLETVTRTLADSNDLRQRMAESTAQTLLAQQAIDALDSLNCTLVDSVHRLQQSSPVIDQFVAMCQTLMDAQPLAAEAQDVAQTLVAIEEDIVYRGRGVETARSALEQLIALRDDLTVEAANVAEGHESLRQLAGLKSAVLMQSDDIIAAVESLESMRDLQEGYRQAAATIQQVREMMVDVALLGPTVDHAVKTLAPITELGNLRRVSGADLRRVVQGLRMRPSSGESVDSVANDTSSSGSVR